MDHQYPTVAKIPVLDTGKFEQWQFPIQQYLQHEHYALCEVIEFGDSYKVPTTTDPNNTTTRKDDEKSGRTVTITTEDMQRKKNDVNARTTLLLSLSDEHQLRFSKYKTTKELWAAILKTFSGNEATKKRKKNLLKQQYGNFKAEGSKTLEQTFNKLQNIAFISSSKHSSRDKDGNTACVPTASTTVPTASASIATISQDTASAYIAVAQLKGRLVEYKEWEVKYIEKIRTLKIGLKTLKLEKDGVDGKLACLLKASNNLDNLIESQRSDKIKDGVGYNAVPPPAADLYLSPKKDLSWTGVPEFVDDTVIDYSRPMPTIKSTSKEDQNKNSSTSEDVASPISPKPFVKFVKSKDTQSEKNKKNNLKSYQLGPEFVLKKKACFNCGDFYHLANECRKRVQSETIRSQNHAYMSPSHRSAGHRPHGAHMRPPHISAGHRPHGASMRPSHRPAGHRPHGPSMNPMRPNMNGARPNRSFFIQAHSYETRPFLKTSLVKTQYRAPWVPTVDMNNPPVNRKFSTGRRNFPTVNRKFPTASRKFTTGSIKIHTADMGRKGKVVKPLACWIWKPSQNLSNKVPRTTLMTKAIGTVAALGT
nr:hypothetical protein [Tanacetum cinerariifolium]